MNRDELHRRIAERAYFYFLARGGEHGRDLEDWLRAEAEIMAQNKPKKSTRKRTTTKGRTSSKTTRRKTRSSAKA